MAMADTHNFFFYFYFHSLFLWEKCNIARAFDLCCQCRRKIETIDRHFNVLLGTKQKVFFSSFLSLFGRYAGSLHSNNYTLFRLSSDTQCHKNDITLLFFHIYILIICQANVFGFSSDFSLYLIPFSIIKRKLTYTDANTTENLIRNIKKCSFFHLRCWWFGLVRVDLFSLSFAYFS